MRWVKRVVLTCRVPLVLVLLMPGIGQAEIYFGGMGGYSVPNDLSGVSSSGEFPDNPIPDADLGNSVMAGGKLGFYLPEYDWFGFEMEGFFTEPEYSSWVARGADAKLQVTTWGFNALVRYPGNRFEPYFGAGPGIFFAEMVTDLPGPALTNNWVPGLNVLGGVRGFVTDSLALFFEYKFNYAKFNLRTRIFNLPYGFEGTYSTNIITGGLSYHFK